MFAGAIRICCIVRLQRRSGFGRELKDVISMLRVIRNLWLGRLAIIHLARQLITAHDTSFICTSSSSYHEQHVDACGEMQYRNQQSKNNIRDVRKTEILFGFGLKNI